MVAIMNIQIPMVLGELTQVLAGFVNVNGTNDVWTWPQFLESVREPSMRLLVLYLAQSCFTFVNIITLNLCGERMASRLREKLFSTVVSQDIAFFDVTPTGEIVNRITSDVQDFKSSLKLCVSQGLRSITQVLFEA